MFEQILIRFRGGPISSSKDEDEESDDNSSDTATTPSASEGLVGRETLQLPLPRPMPYRLSPSTSLGRSPSPPASTTTSASASSSCSPSSSPSPSPSSSASPRSQSPRPATTTMATTRRTTRQTKEPSTERTVPRRGRAKVLQQEEEVERRGQKRKASEMAPAPVSVTSQVDERPPPEKKMTRAEARRQVEEKRTTRSGRKLGAEEGEHNNVAIKNIQLNERASSSSKRKSPFLEPPEHLLKRPASRRSVRSTYDEDEVGTPGASGDDGDLYDIDNDEFNDYAGIDADEKYIGEAGEAQKPRPGGGKRGASSKVSSKKPAARSGVKNTETSRPRGDANRLHHLQATSSLKVEEDARRKLHPLLRPGPDNVAFPWWHNDDWLEEESPARKRRRLQADTKIAVVNNTTGGGDDDDFEGEKRAAAPALAGQQPRTGDEPRKLRSSTRRPISKKVGKAVTTSPVASVAPVPESRVAPPLGKAAFERYELPEPKTPLSNVDPLSDERFAEAHNIRWEQEKVEHKKELEKEQRNFNRYKLLLSQLEAAQDAQDDSWTGILGLENPKSEGEMSILARKKDRLTEELRAATRRYPVYRAERTSIEQGGYDPTFAGWLGKNNRQPLSLKGRVIPRKYWRTEPINEGDHDEEMTSDSDSESH
ncbi:hypothetical protein TWF694_008593 [Orbilia ellipsospora]|uniref:Something about silencing protein 4 domain-containing protein n=1 Tax=Orbilia ellipsospora TaxID=2528407 RepID=A0AAV9XGK7_9PEZI